MDVLRSPLPAAAGKGRRSSLTQQTGLLQCAGGALRVAHHRSSAGGEGLLTASAAAAMNMKGVKVCTSVCVCILGWID